MKNMNQALPNISKQTGWTFWSLAFTLAVVGFFGYVGMQLVPVYSGNQNIHNAMKKSVDGKDLRKVTRSRIIADMDKQLYLDGSHEMLNLKDKKVLIVKRVRNKLTLEAVYERKVPLFFNLSVAADFNPKVECDLTGRCD